MSSCNETNSGKTKPEADSFGKVNWITLLCGLAALVAGFVALALNSTVFAPICIVGAYLAIGVSLIM